MKINKSIIVSCLSMFFVLTLTACGSNTTLGTNDYNVFYISKDNMELVSEVHTLESGRMDTQRLVQGLIEALQKSDTDAQLRVPLDKECRIEDYSINEDKLTLYFDVNYGTLKGMNELLRRGAIVKTLVQVDGINSVEFYVGDEPLMVNKTAVGFMDAKTFVTNTGGTGTMKTTTISLYFADKSGTKLVEVPSEITYDSTVPLGQLMVEELIKGPGNVKNLSKEGLQSTIPDGTTINRITIRDNVCYVDFSTEFTNVLSTVSNNVTIYSVVNVLTELANVNKVQFSVNGEQMPIYGDDITFNLPFERNLDIVENSSKKK